MMASKRLVLTFALLLVITSSPSFGAEKDAPIISDLLVMPGMGGHGTKVKITLKIKDPQGDKDIERFLYQIREGREMIKTSLYDDGTKGDDKANDHIYTGEMVVPDTAAERTHQFSVFVYDRERHKSNILTYEFTVSGKDI